MALLLNINLQNTQDGSLLYLFDNTGQYSLANVGGYGTPNVAASDVISATLGVTVTPIGGAAPTTYAPVTIMPSGSNPFPYLYNEAYQLSPASMGISGTQFPVGIYECTYTINTSSVSLTFTGASGNYVLGGVITDTTTSKGVGTITSITQSGATGTMVLTNTMGNIITHSDALTDGTHTCSANVVTYTNNTYTITSCFEVNWSLVCCMGNLLSTLDCCCNCQPLNGLFANFMYLIGSQAQIGCNKNGEALQSMNCVNNFCTENNCNCGCS